MLEGFDKKKKKQQKKQVAFSNADNRQGTVHINFNFL